MSLNPAAAGPQLSSAAALGGLRTIGLSRGARLRETTLRFALPTVWVGILFVLVLWSLFPDTFAPYDPLEAIRADRLEPPSATHFFGTDNLGRDVFSRVVYATQLSMFACLVAVTFGLLAGAFIGIAAGIYGGRTDSILMRFVDVLLALPDMLLSLVIIAALGFGTFNIAIAVGVSLTSTFARFIRSQVLSIRHQEYMEASYSVGAGRWKAIWWHVVPNVWRPVLALATLRFGSALLAIAALSFLGFATPPPTPEWGAMVSEGRNYMTTAWWLTTLPALVIVIAVIAAEGLSRAFNRKKART